ncbi:MAG: hypothetical protein WCP28_19730 [Actinomycetes bacterium]
MDSYGVGNDSTSGFEFDHDIPLEVGGAPDAVANLWPQPIAASHVKDQLENKIHALVCSGSITLDEGQAAFTGDWQAAWATYQNH